MSEVQIPRQVDELEKCLYQWEESIHDWQTVQEEYHEKETMLKAWEAATKAAIMATKVSAVMAESQVRAMADWAPRYLEVQKLNTRAETKKRIMRLAEARWETERSRQVTLRNVR